MDAGLVNPRDRDKAQRMKDKGIPIREIATKFKVSHTYIHNLLAGKYDRKRFVVEIDPELHAKVKSNAALTHITLRQFVENALEEALDGSRDKE